MHASSGLLSGRAQNETPRATRSLPPTAASSPRNLAGVPVRKKGGQAVRCPILVPRFVPVGPARVARHPLPMG